MSDDTPQDSAPVAAGEPSQGGRVRRQRESENQVGLTFVQLLGVLGVFLGLFGGLFVAIGYWLRSDLQQARTAADQLRERVVAVEKQHEAIEKELQAEREGRGKDRKALDDWSTQIFKDSCDELKGTYGHNFGSCDLPDQRRFKYQAPFPNDR
jgi:hypothetical protein